MGCGYGSGYQKKKVERKQIPTYKSIDVMKIKTFVYQVNIYLVAVNMIVE